MEPDCDFIITKGAGDRAFCSGGDIRILSNYDNFGINLFESFRIAYTMFTIVNSMKIPFISIWNGITMGFGIGFSIYGSHRIATEKTIFCMPEVGVGLIPDVSASYFFNKLPGKLGLYLGLTAARLFGEDVLAAGFATHYTHSRNLPNLERDLLNLENEDGIDDVLMKYCSTTGTSDFSLNKYLDQINKLFTAKNMEEIFENLRNDESEFSRNTLEVKKKCFDFNKVSGNLIYSFYYYTDSSEIFTHFTQIS